MNRIHLLSPQLTNQIAAGEVIERPASVVKELLENSLDAKATRIEIDIEKGGTQLIRVRDDGLGIHRDDLSLALSRHATSKISVLDDLEQVKSLGFRGEALASISSVSRLTLASCFDGENSGWQVRGEGRDEIVDVIPLAHPRGTTIEVRELFFNTPARRKFLRSEQTEFNHLLEVVKRIALSRFDVGINLRHNQRVVHQLRPALDGAAQLRRVADLCAPSFIENALSISAEVQDLKVWGWIALPTTEQKLPDVQYFYVNGRMVRDKLVNHAVRQAYQDRLSLDQQPAFVLYLELDPRAVDVNAHPAKHEVRFRDSRWVHDFLFKALDNALLSGGVEEKATMQPYFPPREASYSTRAPLAAYAALHAAPPLRVAETSMMHYSTTPAKYFPLGNALAQLHQHYALAENNKGLVVIDLLLAQQDLLKKRLEKSFLETDKKLPSQALLMPLTITVNESEAMLIEQERDRAQQFGFDITRSGPGTIMLRKIPGLLRLAEPQAVTEQFISQLSKDARDESALLNCLAEFGVSKRERIWSLSEINALLRELESLTTTTRSWVQWSMPALFSN